MQVTMDKCMSKEESPRLLGRLEGLQLTLPSACRPKRVLSTIIEIAALSVFNIGQQIALRHAIAPQLIGDDHMRHILQTRRVKNRLAASALRGS